MDKDDQAKPMVAAAPGLSTARKSATRTAAGAIAACVFPHCCLLCGANKRLVANLDICSGCLADLPRMRDACTRCADSLISSPGAAGLCGRCLWQPPPFASTWCLGPYEDGLAALVTGLKFGRRLENGRLLGQLLGRHLAAHAHARNLSLMPVPLHASRLRKRGFNQALEIATWAAREARLAILKDSVRRQRKTAEQTGLGARARRANLAHAFSCSQSLHGQHIALVDDVMTTGSTVASLADAVGRAGAARVEVWVCARQSLQ